MYHITKLVGADSRKLYLGANDLFLADLKDAFQFTADKAIEEMQRLSTTSHRIGIEKVAQHLGHQLDARKAASVAGLVGADPTSRTFTYNLECTKPLPHGFTTRDAALAYIDTVRAALVEAAPEARQ